MHEGSLGLISNKSDWYLRIQPVAEDGTDIDLSSMDVTDIQVSIRCQERRHDLVTANLSNGVTIIGTAYQWHFTPSDLSRLCSGTYWIGTSITIDNDKSDLIIGSVAVKEGV